MEIARDSLWTRPNMFCKWETGAVNSVLEERKIEPVYSNTVLTSRRKRRFREKTVMYGTDSNFRMHTVPYMERRVRGSFMIVPNIKEVQIEERMWLSRRQKARELAPPEVPPVTTTLIPAQPAAVSTDPSTAPPRAACHCPYRAESVSLW